MAELFEVDGLRFVVYSNEGLLDKLPSVSVYRQGAEAEFYISHDDAPQVLLKRSFGFSVEELTSIVERLESVASTAREDWVNAFC